MPIIHRASATAGFSSPPCGTRRANLFWRGHVSAESARTSGLAPQGPLYARRFPSALVPVDSLCEEVACEETADATIYRHNATSLVTSGSAAPAPRAFGWQAGWLEIDQQSSGRISGFPRHCNSAMGFRKEWPARTGNSEYRYAYGEAVSGRWLRRPLCP